MAKTSNSQPTAKVTAQVAQIPVSSAAPSSRFERFLARYGYNSLGEKVSADQQPQAAVAAQSVAQMAKTSNSQPTAKVTAQVAKASSSSQGNSQSKQYRVSRKVPVYIFTDPHFDTVALNKIVELKNAGAIVAVVGDFVGTVKRNPDGSCVGGYHGNDQPQKIIDILKNGRGTSGHIVAGYGNHEFYSKEFSGKIDNLQKFGKALTAAGVEPTNLCPGDKGAAPYVKIGNCYFFSYSTEEYSQSMTNEDKQQYERWSIKKIADEIKRVCDSKTEEIFLLNHAKLSESEKITTGVIQRLQSFSKGLKFDLNKVYITASAAHDHYYSGPHAKWLNINGKRVLQVFPKPGVYYGQLKASGKRSFKKLR
ncbi:MAG: metallophosphoesterase [Verrucomicrobiota bacterium]|nr:MAG: metallophosphoesterase [Verrucomicrobiota bacterium]